MSKLRSMLFSFMTIQDTKSSNYKTGKHQFSSYSPNLVQTFYYYYLIAAINSDGDLYVRKKQLQDFVKKLYRSKATEFDSKCIVELSDECQQLTVDNSEHVIEEIIIVPYIMKNKYYTRIHKLFMITPNHSASNANIIPCVSSYIDIIYIICRLKEPIFAAD